MEPHLYLSRGKKQILLVRYLDKLHFVELDHRLNYKVRPWFLEKPRTEAEMDEKGLVRTSVDLKDIRGVAAGGTGRGMVVQFYLKEGKKRYELTKDCDLADMSALFEGLASFDPPKKDSAWHDPRLAKQDPNMRKLLWTVGWLLNLTAIVTGIFIWAVGYEIPWLCWISLLCIPVSLLLYGFFPDYYNIFSRNNAIDYFLVSIDYEKYITNKGSVIFLDTSVITYYLCYLTGLEEEYSFIWDNPEYQSVKSLISIKRGKNEKIHFVIPYDYLQHNPLPEKKFSGIFLKAFLLLYKVHLLFY